ncbi:hypothetical protein OC842_004596 [Tilletia horrida]|uniref:FHA domain-containing protein n=1 Tax=Tilletia horrida TaxID=155126 RepID=A0AAN6JQ48_9BASI|nr:hypothetical protein OC842_004596 [Tilletia horrida]
MTDRETRPSPPRRPRDYESSRSSRWDDRGAPSSSRRQDDKGYDEREDWRKSGAPSGSRWDREDADANAVRSSYNKSSSSSRRHGRTDDRYGEERHRREQPDSRTRQRSRSPPSRRGEYGLSGSSGEARRSQQHPPPDFERDRRRERAAYENAAASRSGPSGDSARGGAGADPDAPPPAEANFAPDFGSSGLLAAASNNVDGIALKYHEPPEARKPKQGKGWRLYVFKDGKDEDLIHLTRQSCYLFGREKRVVDIPLEHPSASKQHAVIQFRQITERNEFGDETRAIRPFLIDLESANGTYLNGAEVPTSRYVELKSGDTLKFGASTREWVLLPEDAA